MKSRNYFSLVLFFILFTFGCTDLYKKDVNTDLEFKIQIPKTRNAQTEAETLKLVVKLSYKDEDTSFERIVYSTSEKIEIITFQNVEVGSKIKISASIFDTENLLFLGETEYKKVEPTNNIFTLTLEKVYVEPEIIDAQVPEISIPLNSIVELATPDSANSIEKQISIGATVSDGGDISFQWQEKVNNAWQDIDGIDEYQVKQNNITERKSHLKITIEKGNTQYYRCIITNTNENANGEKTASITSDEATVAYFEGELTSIKATYNSEEYEIFEQEFYDAEKKEYDYSDIEIEGTYLFSNGDTKIYNTQYTSEKYSIAKTNEAEKAIGYVPYTVTYKETSNSEDPISTTLYVPVKYDLSKATFSIVNSSNSVETFIPQYTGEETLQTQLSFSATSGFDTIHLYNSENTSQPSEYQIENDVDISWLSNSSIITNSEAGTFVYTAIATAKENAWCFGSISSNHTVTVCPWEIAIKDGKGEADLTANKDNLDGYTTYTLSVTNEAEENPSVTWTSDNDDFIISRDSSKLSTPVAGENAQTATITATVGETEVASIEVTVAAIEYGTETNPITDWSMLARKIENTGSDIYIAGEMTATEKITVEKETNIIAAKPVTITRDTSFTDTMFTVNETFTMQGTSEKTIIIDGNNINATNTIISSNNISLSYVYIQNCYSSEILGTAISVNKGDFSLQNSIFKNNSFSYSSILFDGSTIEAEINDCSFEDSIQDLQIYDANSVSISNTLFSQDNYDNLVIKKCNALTLGENILIPNIFYQNYATTSELNIICSDITLNNIDTPITIKLSYYTGEYDLNLFVLQNGETVPENIFTLAEKNYTINTTTGTVEEIKNDAGENITGITYAGTDSTTSLPTFYIYNANGLETFRDIVNGTILNETTTSYEIPADSSITNGTPYSITNTDGQQNIKGILQADIDLSNIEWTPIGVDGKEFAGDFDGNNKSITNLTITDATTTNQGLFGVINNILWSEDKSSIKNLKLSGTITSSATNVGVFAGNATNVSFENCENNISISTSNTEIGGLVGIAETCDFVSCVNLANISSTSTSGNICVGGIAGYITDVNAEYCYNAGNITGNMSVGGLFGYEIYSTLQYPTYDYCINTGTITGTSYIGGIIGYANKKLSLGYCANYGTIDSTETGCIIGECSSTNSSLVTECLSVGSISNDEKCYAVSQNASVTYSYYDSDVLTGITGISSNGGGAALTTEELTNGNDLSNFDSNEWSYENGRYPIPDVQEKLSNYWDSIVTAATPSN